ncbi:hypothetical protein VOLCADRAFT_94706 [Volvox carteri f. nagariensis]|uniref:Uncharacterized protein n=1 Tax=Volvox carteri f. nagariensis TaxID=3068 RepID=D8U5I6_VOLCA|nr:uncharacterized protein VOLCADRAFT_94706 [Volvox carteri f. nagariensis]EFJ44927.1 hypothetical protein VOLCADRAFT_94706 [Volvox carteri f. nagariensis]|eukprot:XP_002953898.1 hypothetical protein VOLCADRAFT_94706 [Volvox carteri f. nagariensis]
MTAIEKGARDGSWRPRAHWSCHRNSIFDLAWAKGDAVLYTASGHQQVGVWDTDTARALAVAEGHDGSVKCISPLHLCEDVFATGARDGRMMLWDARCPGFSGQAPPVGRRTQAGTDLDNAPVLSPVWVQDNAHTRPSTTSGRASTKIAKPASVTVTSVAFLPYSYLLASAGAHDTVVKVWDLRMHGLPLCDLELPKAGCAGRASGHKAKSADTRSCGLPHEVTEFTCPARASAVGVTHLTVSDSGDRLLVSCLDSQHHLFSLSRLMSGPLASWRAPPPAFKGSFYMRSAFSPCGDYILCGSRDCGAHIWMAADPQRSPIELPHEHEVTGVAWCRGDWSKVATCSDSGEVRLWTLNRLPAREARAVEDEAPAMASHVAELDASVRGDVAAEQLRQTEAATADRAGLSTLPSRAVDAVHGRHRAAKPIVIRRKVQQRLNLLPMPAPAPPAAAAPDPATAPANTTDPAPGVGPMHAIPLFAVMEEASAAIDAALVHAAAMAKDNVLLTPYGGSRGMDGKPPLICAAAIRASALASPVSSAPAQPAVPSGPASVRRSSILPPVPIFSPAVNCWQQQQLVRADVAGHETAAAAPPGAAASGTAAGAGGAHATVDMGCGLEDAMKGLPYVRTQSPTCSRPRCGGHGADGLGASADHSWRLSQPCSQHERRFLGKPPLPPPPQQPELPPSLSLAPPPAAMLPPRAQPVSLCTTPVSFNRSRSRLSPFSPSRTSLGSGSGLFSTGMGSCGQSNGAPCGTPTGSQRHGLSGPSHQAPQGVVDQILRNSPRYGSRTGFGGGNLDFMVSPRFRRMSGGDLGPDAGESPVQRRLFDTDGDADAHPLGSDAGRAIIDAADDPTPRLHLGNSTDIIAAIDSLLQCPSRDSRGRQAGVGMAVLSRSPRLTFSPIMYDVQDGQDVGPALRYRAANPDDMGPYYGFTDGLARDDEAGDVNRRMVRFSPEARELRIAWDGDGAGEQERMGDSVGPLAVRHVDDSFFMPSGSVANGDDSESDWEFDPYGDKENMPPPEPLPPPPAPTSSASAGGSGLPSAGHAEDQPLPLPLIEPSSSTPTRAAATASVTATVAAATSVTVSTPEQPRVRMVSPFAAAFLPFASTAEFAEQDDGPLRLGTSPSLHSEPTVSAGIAPSTGVDNNDGQPSDGEVRDVPDLGPSYMLASLTGGADNGSDAAAASPPRQQRLIFYDADEMGEAAARAPHVSQFHGDNLTPTKRPRRAYSSSDNHDLGPAERSPSPARRVRSSGVLAGPAQTPARGRQGHAGGFAALASPCTRGGRHGGASRLAPAPCAGYLVTTAATASAGIGSESPMPKVGTASRTGRRHTVPSEEYLRRRMEDDRDCGLTSPFGFGMFMGTETPGGCGRDPRTASRLAQALDAAASGPGPGLSTPSRGTEAEHAQERGMPGLHLPASDDNDEDAEAVQQSVRSLSCVFETQTQGGSTLMVPCSFPAGVDEGEDDQGGGLGQVEQELRREMLTFEERTVGSPALQSSEQPGGFGEVDEGGHLESRGVGSEYDGGGQGRQCSFRFSSFFDRASQQLHRHPSSGAMELHAAPVTQLLLDESSRSFPANRGEGVIARRTGGLHATRSGQGPQRESGPLEEQSRMSLGGPGLNELLGLSPAFGTPITGGPPSGRTLPDLSRTIPMPSSLPSRAEEGGPGAAAADGCCVASEEQQQVMLAHSLRKHRQQTLQQCWGGAAPRHPTPLGMRPAGHALGLQLPPSKTLGPTGLTSPKYFR